MVVSFGILKKNEKLIMKKLILFLFVALFSLGFVACKDDDNSLPIEEKIAGSYKGTLDIMML